MRVTIAQSDGSLEYEINSMLTLLGSSPKSFTTARDCAANASFNSKRSTSSLTQPALFNYKFESEKKATLYYGWAFTNGLMWAWTNKFHI